jgi:hypothetical protein
MKGVFYFIVTNVDKLDSMESGYTYERDIDIKRFTFNLRPVKMRVAPANNVARECIPKKGSAIIRGQIINRNRMD